ncbi:MAG: ATP-binding protein, partial [Clostridia bacterium]
LWAAAAVLALAAALLDRRLPGIAAAAAAAVASLAGFGLAMTRGRAISRDALAEAGVESVERLAAERLFWDEMGARVTEREQAEERLRASRAELDEARARLDRAREDHALARDSYDAIRRDEDLPDLSPAELQHWLSWVDDALHTVSLYRREQESVQILEDRREAFFERARQTAEFLHVDLQETRNPGTWLELRREWLDIPKREERLRELEDEVEQAREEALKVGAALQDCLRELDAPTVEVAAVRVAEGLHYEELSREAMRLEAELSAASQGLGVDGFQPYVDVGLGDALEAARARFEDARAVHQARQQEAAELRRHLSDLESSGELADLRLRAEARRAEATRLYQRWASYTLAAEVLQKSREHFQRERQPDVLRRASELFSAFTSGRYVRVLASADQVRDLAAELNDGRQYPVEALSRGTQEQLYLALRLAWIESREQHSERMPLILDDILVNADPDREQVMARTLVRFARGRQVIYLTCHPEAERTLKKARSRPPLEWSEVLAAR